MLRPHVAQVIVCDPRKKVLLGRGDPAVAVRHFRIWRAFSLQPHRVETFKLSTDPFFVEKVRDIVGLYLNAPEACSGAVCGREKPSPGTRSHTACTALTAWCARTPKGRPEKGAALRLGAVE